MMLDCGGASSLMPARLVRGLLPRTEMRVTPRKFLRGVAEITALPVCAKKGYSRQRKDELSHQGTAESPLCDCSFVAHGIGRENLAHRTPIKAGRHRGKID